MRTHACGCEDCREIDYCHSSRISHLENLLEAMTQALAVNKLEWETIRRDDDSYKNFVGWQWADKALKKYGAEK